MINRIRDIRKQKGLTLADVAAACDPPTTAQTIGRLETGTRTLSLDWMNRIASALDVDAEVLVRSNAAPAPRIIAQLTPAGAEPLASPRDAILPSEIGGDAPLVVMAIEAEEEVATGVGARQAEHKLHRLGAGEQIAHFLGGRHMLNDPLGQLDFQHMVARRIQVIHGVHLLSDRSGQDRMAVAEDASAQTGHVVQVFVAVDIPQMHALAVSDVDRGKKLIAGQIAVRPWDDGGGTFVQRS